MSIKLALAAVVIVALIGVMTLAVFLVNERLSSWSADVVAKAMHKEMKRA